MIELIRRRRRLEVVRTLRNKKYLKRYRDPETGLHYVGLCRWDPAMIESVSNRRTERS